MAGPTAPYNSSSTQGFPNIAQPVVTPGLTVTQAWLNFFQAVWNRTGAALAGSTIPTGSLVDWAGPASNAPLGYLPCDGSLVSVTTYAALFAAIGTTWGGDGIENFRLPKFINAFALGAAVAGETGGSAAQTITAQNLPVGTPTALASNATTGSSAGGVNTSVLGQGVAFSILPPYATVVKLIKT
jgi:hypothetical protein